MSDNIKRQVECSSSEKTFLTHGGSDASAADTVYKRWRCNLGCIQYCGLIRWHSVCASTFVTWHFGNENLKRRIRMRVV